MSHVAAASFQFCRGKLAEAMDEGEWFLADEMNLAQPSILNELFPLLDGTGVVAVPGTDRYFTAQNGFHFFATQNDETYANRKPLGRNLRNRFVVIKVPEFTDDEMQNVLLRLFKHSLVSVSLPAQLSAGGVSADAVAETTIRTVIRVFNDVRNCGRLGLTLTVRDLIKWMRRSHRVIAAGQSSLTDVLRCGFSLLSHRLRTCQARQELRSIFVNHDPSTAVDDLPVQDTLSDKDILSLDYNGVADSVEIKQIEGKGTIH